MKTLSAILMALALAVLPAVPALAGGGAGQDMVTKTFKLTIYGNNAANDDFIVDYATPQQIAASQGHGLPGTLVLLCGQLTSKNPPPPGTHLVNVSKGDCVGNGSVYTYSVQLPRGTKLAFLWGRVPRNVANSMIPFYSSPTDKQGNPTSYEEVDGPMTNSAWFRYGPSMPNTGAGGTSRSSLPLGDAAAATALAAAAGYLVWRRARGTTV